MTSLDKRAGPVTAVNMFNIRPDKLESFVAVWPELVEFMTKQPGFRSSTLLRALLPDSRFQLINIAEWDSAAELHATMAEPKFQARMSAAIDEFGVAAQPGLYRVAVENATPL
jgi:heme oxygenase (mycobilin-producing)